MKFLALLLVLLPIAAYADNVELDVGFGQGTKPFYGADYQFSKDLPYADLSLTGNSQYLQPYVSFGVQFEHINLGLANAVTLSNVTNGGPVSAQYSVGPEVGYQQNINPLVYVKESNSYMGFNGPFSLSCTLSLGLNL